MWHICGLAMFAWGGGTGGQSCRSSVAFVRSSGQHFMESSVSGDVVLMLRGSVVFEWCVVKGDTCHSCGMWFVNSHPQGLQEV